MKPHSVVRTLLILSLVMVMLAVVACGGGAAQPTPPPDQPAPTPTPEAEEHQSAEGTGELVKTVALLYQMKGHLVSSRELWEQGDPMAGAHAAHPQTELFSLVADDLRAVDPAQETRLLEALKPLPKLVAENTASADEIKTAYETAFAAIDEAAKTLAGDSLNDPAFVAQVIAEVLEGVAEEYAEAVQDGQVTNLEEYQDAYGFLQVARQLFESIAEATRTANAEEYAEIEEAFEELSAWLPAAAAPPDPPADPSLVSTATKTVRAELSEVYGFALAEASREDTLAFIREQVELALHEYEEGETEEAYELAASAYLDGFEHLEGELLGKDPELVETLEIQFKELRDKIRAGAPIEELRALQQEIESNLTKVAELLESE